MSATTSQGVAAETVEQALARAQAAAAAKRTREAVGICDDLLAAQPELPAALALLGTLHAQQGRLGDAIACLERACARDASVPGWHANLCATYRLACRPEEALAAGLRAVRLNADTSQFLLNLALAQVDLNLRDEAVPTLLRAVGLNEDDASAHLALAQLLLARGDFAPGWTEYEWRNKTAAAQGTMPRTTSAHWNGMTLPGGRILLIGDQGYGDTIQFARYIPMVAARCEEVMLGCSAELAGVVGRMPGVGRCFSAWTDVPGHAAYCPLSSLPWIFETRLDTVPAPVPYIHADAARVDSWRSRLADFGHGRPRIGLAWAGRPTHPNDMRRSFRLERLKPLRDAVRGALFVSLQTPFPEADRGCFPELADNSADLSDFDETAAAIANLDLVITADTAVAHLAGAMGKPVWVLIGQAPDWRWLLDRADSPWYPTLRLFRQRRPGDWDPVVAEVATALRRFSSEFVHHA